MSVDVAILDLDPDAVSAAQVAELTARGVETICYVSVGTTEDWRQDAARFPAAIVGRPYDAWPGERFLDLRALDLLLPIMEARFAACRDKGFVAVEPDNIDIYHMTTGFDLQARDAVAYARALAEIAHRMGLAIGQKNAPDLVPDLVAQFDFALFEECHEGGFCTAAAPYVRAGKPVLNVEYRWGDVAPLCQGAAAQGILTIFKRPELDAWRQACPPPAEHVSIGPERPRP